MTARSSHKPVVGTDPERVGRALTSGELPVAVYGLGKMGLPLAAVFAEVTGNTLGVDIDEEVVAGVNRGECHVEEPDLPDLIAETVDGGALQATVDPTAAAKRARIHVVIVPTLLSQDSEPDLSQLRAAIEAVGAGLSSGDLVCVESTVPPGTCRDVVAPVLAGESELDTDEFGLAFCPERTASGRALEDIRGAYPKVVGGVDERSTTAAAAVYEQVTDNEIRTVADATTAECVKVFEGVYRDVNIALANELATLADELGVNVREAIVTANTQPFCDIHDPGPGVGGHCIPYYPYFLVEGCTTGTPLLRTAREVNEAMPAYTAAQVLSALQATGRAADATVAILGAAYRPGVDEIRESPGLAIADLLADRVGDLFVVDPIVDDHIHAFPARSVDELRASDPDAVVLVTPHESFERVDWEGLETVVVDGRDALPDLLEDSVPADPETVTLGDGH